MSKKYYHRTSFKHDEASSTEIIINLHIGKKSSVVIKHFATNNFFLISANLY